MAGIGTLSLLDVTHRQIAMLVKLNLGVAQRTVLELDVGQLLVQCLMLADLALVEFLLSNAHARRDARREMRAAGRITVRAGQ